MTPRRIVVVDNYDSFTYNLVQLLAEEGVEVTVRRNDETDLAELASFQGLVISPGPGGPAGAGISVEAIRELSGRLPILGVCLGHQCLAEAFGGEVVRSRPRHGMTSWVLHDGMAPFTGLSDPFEATRYHSLVVERESLPHELEVSAWTSDGIVMGLRHRRHRTYGVQFHPEAVLTLEGRHLLRNFLTLSPGGAG
jgi:anthranilate synthase/aminodeoxychorismate synthase-like glutamine amidotransferase